VYRGGEKGSHSRAVGTTVHYSGRERFTLKDCEHYSTLQREREVHTPGLLVPQYTTEVSVPWYQQPSSVYLSLPVLFTVVFTVIECVPLSPSVVYCGTNNP
jgi:hypothetical protein